MHVTRTAMSITTASSHLSTRNVPARRATLALGAIAATLAVGVYLNALDNPFVFDDRTEILENPSIRSLGDLPSIVRHSLTRPVTNLSYAVDFANWGEHPYGYHLTNVLLHVANVVLLFSWLGHVLRAFSARSLPQLHVGVAAFAGAGLFAVHPMMTEAVGYVSGRAEVLCTTLVLSSAYCLTRSFASTGKPMLAARTAGVVLFALALGAKEIAVVLPAVVVAYDLLWRGGRANWRTRLWTVHVPLIVAVMIMAIGRMWWYVTMEHPDAAGFDWRHVLVELHVIQRYLTMLVVPASQSVVHAVYPFQSLADPRTLPAVGVVGAALFMAWLARRREPLVTFGIVWLFLALVPSAMLILLASKGQPMAEHRVYLASCGFFMVCASFVCNFLAEERVPGRGRLILTAVVLTVAIGLLAALTIARNRIWSDPVLLWQDAASKAPHTWAAQYASADAYLEAGNCQAAIAPYRRALALDPQHVGSYLGLVECMMQLQRATEAQAVLREASMRIPDEPRLRSALARVEASLPARRY